MCVSLKSRGLYTVVHFKRGVVGREGGRDGMGWPEGKEEGQINTVLKTIKDKEGRNEAEAE